MTRADILKNLANGQVSVSQSDYLAQIERIDARGRELRMEILTWVATGSAIAALVVSIASLVVAGGSGQP